MKKIINDLSIVVGEVLVGMVVVYFGWIIVYFDLDYIVCVDVLVCGKVVFVFGGGSGYELLYGGFVGKGMLLVVIFGVVFILLIFDFIVVVVGVVDGRVGVFFIVKNYMGDVFNFEIVVDFVMVDGVDVVLMIIDDDVVVKDLFYMVGCWGVVGIVFVEKIVGVVVECGDDFVVVMVVVEKVNV